MAVKKRNMLYEREDGYEMLPIILTGTHDLRAEKDARKLAAIAIMKTSFAKTLKGLSEQDRNL